MPLEFSKLPNFGPVAVVRGTCPRQCLSRVGSLSCPPAAQQETDPTLCAYACAGQTDPNECEQDCGGPWVLLGLAAAVAACDATIVKIFSNDSAFPIIPSDLSSCSLLPVFLGVRSGPPSPQRHGPIALLSFLLVDNVVAPLILASSLVHAHHLAFPHPRTVTVVLAPLHQANSNLDQPAAIVGPFLRRHTHPHAHGFARFFFFARIL